MNITTQSAASPKKALVILLVGFALLSLSNGKKSAGNSDTGSGGETVTKILVIGDSIGTGFGIELPYPDRISAETGVTVINDSANNRQTSNGAAIADGLLAAHMPSHLIVLLGTNDARKGIVSATLANLQSMINDANKIGATAIVGTLPPFTKSSKQNNNSAQISNGIRKLSGGRIAEIRNKFGDGSNTIADGIHPNDRGQQIIADEFIKLL